MQWTNESEAVRAMDMKKAIGRWGQWWWMEVVYWSAADIVRRLEE